MMRKAVAVLVVFAIAIVPVGFAWDYSGQASASYGSSDGACIFVETYTYDGGEYTESDILVNKAGVTKTGNTYTLSADSELLTPSNLYIYIHSIGYNGSVVVSCDLSVAGVGSCSAALDGSALTERTVSQGYHSFAVYFSGSYSGNTMPQSDVTVTVSVSAISTQGAYTHGSDAVRLKATSAATVLEIMEESNPEIVSSEDYTFSSTTSTNHGNNYPAVGVQNENNNQNGIADNQGNIDVQITVPAGPSFVLYLRTSGSNTFQLTMSKGSEILVSGTVTFNSGIGTSGYYLSSHSSDGSSSGYFYSSLNAVNSNNAWMSGDSQDISIVILTEDGQSASRNLKMDIVFKKES